MNEVFLPQCVHVLLEYDRSNESDWQVKGFLERDGTKLDAPRISGKWDDALYVEQADGTQQQLWKISPMPANPTRLVAQPCMRTPDTRGFLSWVPLKCCRQSVQVDCNPLPDVSSVACPCCYILPNRWDRTHQRL